MTDWCNLDKNTCVPANLKERSTSDYISLPETKLAEFPNSVDLNEVAHHEPPHLDLHFCPLVFEFSI